jgi:hypothetical protein
LIAAGENGQRTTGRRSDSFRERAGGEAHVPNNFFGWAGEYQLRLSGGSPQQHDTMGSQVGKQFANEASFGLAVGFTTGEPPRPQWNLAPLRRMEVLVELHSMCISDGSARAAIWVGVADDRDAGVDQAPRKTHEVRRQLLGKRDSFRFIAGQRSHDEHMPAPLAKLHKFDGAVLDTSS